MSQTPKEPSARTFAADASAQARSHRLHSLSWRNWLFLAAVSLVTIIGLVTAIPPLLSKRIFTPWPWEKTDLVLLAGLSLTVLAFVVYLTHQQRRVLGMQRELHELQEERTERTKRHYARLFALLNVSRIMGIETNLQEVFDCITRLCVETFMGNRSSLMLYDKDAGDLVIRSANGDYNAPVIGRRRDLGEGIAGWSALHRRPLFLSRNVDLSQYPGLDVEDTTVLAAMVVPIIVREELVGVLNVSTQRPDVVYDEEDLKALQVFAENAGACIRHAEHADWMRMTIERLQSSLRERTGHTGARSSAETNPKQR